MKILLFFLISFPTAYLRLHLSSIVTSAVTSNLGLHALRLLHLSNVGNLPDVLNYTPDVGRTLKQEESGLLIRNMLLLVYTTQATTH